VGAACIGARGPRPHRNEPRPRARARVVWTQHKTPVDVH
jgi:hypothetical protein